MSDAEAAGGREPQATRVHFFSDGTRLAGHQFLPESAPGKYPAIVIGAGWSGTKGVVIDNIATKLAASGVAALTFDYRGCGESDGRPNRLFPAEQAVDARAAVAFLRSVPSIDPDRISLLGLLTGAAAALQAASEDAAVAAVVCMFPFGDGERWMRSLRPHWEWRVFRQRLAADRARRSITGASELVDPNEILIRGPEGVRRELRSREITAARRRSRLGLDSADAIISFKPEDHVHRIAPRAVMVIAVEDDLIAPLEEVRLLYQKLCEPKRLLLLRGIEHDQIYEPGRLDAIIREIVAFVDEWTPARRAEAGSALELS